MKTVMVIVVSLLLGGCASTIEAWKGRAWGSHNYRPEKIYVGSADRRIVISGKVGEQKVICPELAPEIAVSRGASSTPTLTLNGAQALSLADSITIAQMKGHELDGSSQKYAMIHWTLCTAYLNGTIDRSEYRKQLLLLVDDGRAAMMTQAATAKDIAVAAAKAVTPTSAGGTTQPAAQQKPVGR